MFVEISVWERFRDEHLAVYHCLQELPGGRYSVQGKELVSTPTISDPLRQPERQLLRPLSEIPEEESFHPTLEAAIRHYNKVLNRKRFSLVPNK